MSDHVQPFDPAGDLLVAARRVTADWVTRSIVAAARRGRIQITDREALDRLDRVVSQTTGRILAELADLLGRDVDDQHTNPLSIYRGAVDAPTGFLHQLGVPVPPADRFADERFPGDPYHLGPATWSDIDPAMHLPGLVWGAWKAKTVLDRRRTEGKR